jgi:ribosomal protein S18 acetylase RimI-like enzyme
MAFGHLSLAPARMSQRSTSQTANGVMIATRVARLLDVPLLVALEREFDRDEHQLVLRENPKVKPYLRTRLSARLSAQWMRNWIRSRNALVLIAEADSVPCGFSVAWIQTSSTIFRPKRYGFIGIMFVKRQYRGRRISSLMMKEAFSWFARRKIKYVSLTVIEDNKHARRIYEKWGFRDFVITMWKVD